MIPGVTESIVTGSFSIFGAGLISIPLYWHLEGEHPSSSLGTSRIAERGGHSMERRLRSVHFLDRTPLPVQWHQLPGVEGFGG